MEFMDRLVGFEPWTFYFGLLHYATSWFRTCQNVLF